MGEHVARCWRCGKHFTCGDLIPNKCSDCSTKEHSNSAEHIFGLSEGCRICLAECFNPLGLKTPQEKPEPSAVIVDVARKLDLSEE